VDAKDRPADAKDRRVNAPTPILRKCDGDTFKLWTSHPGGLIERDYLEPLLAGRLGGLRPRRGAKIWLLATLESWLRMVFAA